MLQTINFCATRKQQCLLCIVKPLQSPKFPRNKKVESCVCNLYQSDSFFSYIRYDTHGVASYKQACVTRFTMKQQFMKNLIKRRKKLNVEAFQKRFYESLHNHPFWVKNILVL